MVSGGYCGDRCEFWRECWKCLEERQVLDRWVRDTSKVWRHFFLPSFVGTKMRVLRSDLRFVEILGGKMRR